MFRTYLIFAVFATVVNLITQWICFSLYPGEFRLYVAMVFGTFLGLISKYILDKKYIFEIKSEGKKEFGTFLLYSFTGGFTTFIFWGTEMLFAKLWEAQSMKYVGAILGLALGYTLKYQLDKRFVFQNRIL